MSEWNNEYLKIATMTNKEAAEIIKNMICHAIIGRGNGKTLLMLKYNTALHKAIQCLEKYPDEEAATEELDFREFMEHLEKETEGTFHRGLRADMKIIDEPCNMSTQDLRLGIDKLDPSCYGKYDRVLMERMLEQQNDPLTAQGQTYLNSLTEKFTADTRQNDVKKVWITTAPISDGDKGYYGKFELDTSPIIGIDLAAGAFNRDNLIFPEEMEKKEEEK